jgi:chaperonin GroES
MSIRPLGDRVLVKPLEQEEVTKSGIVLPDTGEKEKKAQGEVLAIGEGEEIKKLKLKTGDKVLYGKYAGDEVEVDKTNYRILKHDEVLAVMQ